MIELIRIRRKNGEKGQALAEFALLIPIFLILLFAIVDFGMGFHSWITVTNAAREGARLGAVLATTEQIEDRVFQTSDLPNESTNMTVTVTRSRNRSRSAAARISSGGFGSSRWTSLLRGMLETNSAAR